jgi:RNA polymerase sigma-70 factor, ECF subfamily
MEQKNSGSALSGVAAPQANEYEAGNDADFERLYQNSYGKTLGTLTAMLGDRAAAEDCVQDAFEHAYKKWPDWQPIAPAEAWLHRIAINAAVSHLRKMRIRELGELIRRIGRPGFGPDPQLLAEHRDLAEALAKLPPRQRATIVLRHYHGYTNRAISQATGVPERTVASRLAIAKRRLRGILDPTYSRGGSLEQSAKRGFALAWPEGRHGYYADRDVVVVGTEIGLLESTP